MARILLTGILFSTLVVASNSAKAGCERSAVTCHLSICPGGCSPQMQERERAACDEKRKQADRAYSECVASERSERESAERRRAERERAERENAGRSRNGNSGAQRAD